MKKIKFNFLFVVLFIFTACKNEVIKKDFTLKGMVFGTTYKITYLNAEENYQKALDSLFLDFNNSLSTYIPNSDISRINNGDTSIEVDNNFIEVFNKSKKIYKQTNGFFDPTVGNLVNAYGFGPKNKKNELSQEQIAIEMNYVGLDKVTLKGKKISKESPEIYLDFNSIAKGFGIDIVARFGRKIIQNWLEA